MNSQRNKFKRGQNFSTEEEFLLITMAAEQRQIFENKKCDAVTWKEKERAWDDLAVAYSSKSGIKRSGLSLRTKYESLKKKLGAGIPYGHPTQTPSVSEKLREILGDDDTGGENSDSDYSYFPVIIDDCKAESIGDIIEFTGENSNENGELTTTSRNPTGRSRRYAGRLFQEEKLRLIRAQRHFYEQENIRAREKHLEEMETLSAKRELLYMEIAEKKMKLNDSSKDS
ncbi:uncharacterized protein LOC6535113 isoform X1 [Drosophila yakuba]|uniref:uncharacterized protein LOC6535113 isoform X1 n=1 Tax=Drosophila yakuba TaxID=7245 RepID=UPI0019307FD1|nr:uncharacterized protein LOC6535113 isoform X1 [Drosophila yakuba]XP_039230609.1 uncharacterized protein LOC6535113 isoform X1 [Drosophila yakuba]